VKDKKQIESKLRAELVAWFDRAGFVESELVFSKLQNEGHGEYWGMGAEAYGADGGCVRHAVRMPQ